MLLDTACGSQSSVVKRQFVLCVTDCARNIAPPSAAFGVASAVAPFPGFNRCWSDLVVHS